MQIEKYDSTTIQRYIEKKIKTEIKIDYVNIKISNFSNVLNEKQQKKTFATTTEINIVIHRSIFQRFKTFHSNLTKKIEKNENKNHNMNEMLKKSRIFQRRRGKNLKKKTDQNRKFVRKDGQNCEGIERQNTDQEKHDKLNWTGCYNDDCQTHYSSKENSGWFPRRPEF